ncbi:MAG: hypothetical protein CMH56_13880 [Myxococcales bacterium]|nr:hypothetical protein [Myxococcales bacterium]|tara:strand:+ start:303 stop:737 length:435 start_codon:yes stop_codon:yes gene_type:complete
MTTATNGFDNKDDDFLLNEWRLPQKKLRGPNRRKGPDLWVQAMTYLSIGGWALLVLAVLMLDVAAPETETFFHRLMKEGPKPGWNVGLKQAVFILVTLCQGLSVAGIMANRHRMRRKTDRFRWDILGLALASAGVGTMLFMLNK